MTTGIRKKYSKEFKLDAVSLVIDQGYSREEADRSLRIGTPMLSHWAREYQADSDGQALRGHGKLTPEQTKIGQLKAKNNFSI